MTTFTQTTVVLLCFFPLACNALTIDSPFSKKQSMHQKALNQLKLINDCIDVVMAKIKDELVVNGSIVAVTPENNMSNLVGAGKMCHGIVENISNDPAGVITIEMFNGYPVIPALRNDRYVFTPLDQDTLPVTVSSTDISEWVCTSYTAGNINSNAASFKAYGATPISLLTSDPVAMPHLNLCT